MEEPENVSIADEIIFAMKESKMLWAMSKLSNNSNADVPWPAMFWSGRTDYSRAANEYLASMIGCIGKTISFYMTAPRDFFMGRKIGFKPVRFRVIAEFCGLEYDYFDGSRKALSVGGRIKNTLKKVFRVERGSWLMRVRKVGYREAQKGKQSKFIGAEDNKYFGFYEIFFKEHKVSFK